MITSMSQPARVRVDSEDEIKLFTDMVAGRTKQRVILIRAEGGMGKSELLREYNSHCPENAKLAILDFKDGSIPDLADLLSRLGLHIGWKHLRALAAHISKFTSPAANISDNRTIIGRTEINVALTAPDDETRKFLRAAMTDALVADLCSAGPIIIIFDTFNHCAPELAIWLSGFLARSCTTPSLTVVVSGRDVPEPSLEWESHCYLIQLKPIASEHWHNYARQVGATSLSFDFIDGCCRALNGHCLSIASFLESEGGRHA
jgi:hypothetical protein